MTLEWLPLTDEARKLPRGHYFVGGGRVSESLYIQNIGVANDDRTHYIKVDLPPVPPTHKFKVGDRVRTVHEGCGTIHRAPTCEGGLYLVEMDVTGLQFAYPEGELTATKLSKENAKFNVGDIVKYMGSVYRITGINEDGIWPLDVIEIFTGQTNSLTNINNVVHPAKF